MDSLEEDEVGDEVEVEKRTRQGPLTLEGYRKG